MNIGSLLGITLLACIIRALAGSSISLWQDEHGHTYQSVNAGKLILFCAMWSLVGLTWFVNIVGWLFDSGVL